MDIENQVIDNKAKIKMLELRLNALLKILAKEGVLTTKEIESEMNRLLEAGESEG